MYAPEQNLWLLTYLGISFVELTLAISSIFYFNFNILYKIRKMSKILDTKTSQMQLIFFRCVFVLSIFTILCLILPMIILILNTFHILSNIYVIVVVGALQPVHVPIGYVLMLMIVKPYREFVINLVFFWKKN
jgi:hypothetical protein